MTRGDSVGIRGSPFIHMCSRDMNGLPALVFQYFYSKYIYVIRGIPNGHCVLKPCVPREVVDGGT